MTLEQLLKSRGYSDVDLAAMSTVLADPKFRKSMEDTINEAENLRTLATKQKGDLDAYDKWFTDEISPEFAKVTKEREDAVAEAAGLKARLELQQKRAMERQGNQQSPEAMAEANRIQREAEEAARKSREQGPRYVDEATFQGAFENTGKAIATGVNIALRHAKLFPDVEIDMEALHAEARSKKVPVKQYWEEKYHVAEKVAELAAKEKADAEARIRADERQKLSVEFGLGSNPNMRPMMPSNNPFVARHKTDTKQPWERSESELTNSRITKAYEKAAARGDA